MKFTVGEFGEIAKTKINSDTENFMPPEQIEFPTG